MALLYRFAAQAVAYCIKRSGGNHDFRALGNRILLGIQFPQRPHACRCGIRDCCHSFSTQGAACIALDCHGRCFFMDISCRAFTVGAWGALADRRIGSCVYWNIPAPGNKGYYSFPADLNFIKNLDPPVFVA